MEILGLKKYITEIKHLEDGFNSKLCTDEKISDVEDRWEGNIQIITWIKKDGKYTKDHT